MTKTLVKGSWYTVTTASGCTITDANGTTLGTAEAGKQFAFQATTELITFSDPAATVLANPKHAPVAAGNSSGGNDTLYPVSPTLINESRAPTAAGMSALAVGLSAGASGAGSVAVGNNSTASDFGATALGYGAQADGKSSVALGAYSRADSSSVALGVGAQAASGSIAIGVNTQVQGAGVGFGYGDLSESGFSVPEGEIVFFGTWHSADYTILNVIVFAGPLSPLANESLDGAPGIVVLCAVLDSEGSITSQIVRGATWAELLPRDLSSTPAAMSLEDEPAPLNTVQQFMQMVANIQACKQAAANS